MKLPFTVSDNKVVIWEQRYFLASTCCYMRATFFIQSLCTIFQLKLFSNFHDQHVWELLIDVKNQVHSWLRQFLIKFQEPETKPT